MWEKLSDFSDERILTHYYGSNLEPMRKFLFTLRKKEYAQEVFAYTSLEDFCVTLQPEYSYKLESDVISVNYATSIKVFSVSYSDIHFQECISHFCNWKSVFSLYDALILRLVLTKENHFIQLEEEIFPSFEIGQKVETTSHKFNQTYRKGNIYKIEKHHKKSCFMYFLEENGKKIKKRYFKEQLINK